MADIAANLDAVVPTNGTRERCSGVSLAQHNATSFDNVEAFPDHGDDGAGVHVLDESGEETFAGEVSVMLLQKILRCLKIEKKVSTCMAFG